MRTTFGVLIPIGALAAVPSAEAQRREGAVKGRLRHLRHYTGVKSVSTHRNENEGALSGAKDH